MNHRYLLSLAFFVGLFSPTGFGWSIEEVIAPSLNDASLEIRRSALFRDGDQVKLGRCDVLEAECAPDNATLVLKRQISYEKYLSALAERFQIPAQYLIHHDKGAANYESYIALLTKSMQNQDLPREEQQAARTKLDLLISRGGVLDRFRQALIIKRALEWVPDEKTAEEVHGRFALVDKLQKRFAPTEKLPANSDYEAFLVYVAKNAKDEDVRQLAGRFLTKLDDLQKSGPEVYKKVTQDFTREMLKGSQASRQKAKELDEFLGGIKFSRSLGSSVVQAYESFLPYLVPYHDSLVLKNPPMATDVFNAADWVKKVVTYEKSVRQFEQSLWPMNYALEKDAAKDRIDEVSTGKTWVLAGTSLTYLEAYNACQKLGHGYTLPNFVNDVAYSSPWLSLSPLASQIAAVEGEKRFWVDGSAITNFKRDAGKAMRWVNVGYNSKTQKEVPVFQYDYDFPTATMAEKSHLGRKTVKTEGEEPLSAWKSIQEHGEKTSKAATLCIGPTREASE